MNCPNCGAPCWRNEVDIGVGTVHDEWKCSNCNWDEYQNLPMTDVDWDKFLEADDCTKEKGPARG